MSYLSEMGVVHRDLAARNCLVTGESDKHLCLSSSRPPVVVKVEAIESRVLTRVHCRSRTLECLVVCILTLSTIECSLRVAPFPFGDFCSNRWIKGSTNRSSWLPPEALNTGVFNLQTDIWWVKKAYESRYQSIAGHLE